MFAVINSGGKQYLVSPDQVVRLEKIDAKIGDKVSFDTLLISDKDVKIGQPLLSEKVDGVVVEHGKAKKVTGVKFHNKVRYRRTFGHRQNWTKVKIGKIA